MHTMVISGNAVAGKICLMASLISFMLHADLIELSATWTFGYNFNSGEAWVGGEPAAAGNDDMVTDTIFKNWKQQGQLIETTFSPHNRTALKLAGGCPP